MKRATLALGAIALGLTMTATPATASPSTHRQLDTGPAHDYWTAKRMSRAIPAGTPKAKVPAARRAARRLARLVPFYVSEPVPDPTALPYPAVGKVFFRLGRASYVCSAAVVDAPKIDSPR